MYSLRNLCLLVTTIVVAHVMGSCQGPLDTDLSENFNNFAEGVSASGTSSSNGTSASGNSGNTKDSNENEKMAEKLLGMWICYQQDWYEDGEHWDKSYSDERLSLTFNPDGSGRMSSGHGDNEMFEIGGSASFNWSVKNGRIYTSIYEGEVWKIISLSNSSMSLEWVDEDYRIVCKFKKKG